MKHTELIDVNFTYLPILNFALQQNKVEIIRDLVIENLGDALLTDVVVELQLEPSLGKKVSFRIDSIPSHSKIRPQNLKWDLSALDFLNFTEKLEASIELSVSVNNEILFSKSYPLAILAFDQWGGISVMPEILSAFVTPNHPAIANLLKRTADILGKWTGNPALDAYQSKNPDRVNKQIAALYATISELQIIYTTAPPSFEVTGQRIRLVDMILNQKLANCLEMALLFASCLEAMGLHPLIVLTNGHAFSGAWLIEDSFADATIDDFSLLTKLMADGINEIALVETTFMCTQKETASFEQAEDKIKTFLNDKDFILAIDLHRTRLEGVRPLPQRVSDGTKFQAYETDVVSVDKSDLKPQDIHRYDLSNFNSEVVFTKQTFWERKLLDLSLRNNLLNLRITKNTLQLLVTDTDLLEDEVARGKEFVLLPKPQNLKLPEANFGIYDTIKFDESLTTLISTDLKQNRVRTLLSDKETEQAIIQLYRNSKTSMEENGANTLFLAVGLLKWFESKSSERPRYAPILLIPVEIIRKSVAKGYVLRSREEDTLLNVTLLEMLRQNFNIAIPSLDNLPTDENGVDVKLINSIVRNAIKTQSRWDVLDHTVLGIFSFSKFIMWNDIHNNSQKLAQNQIVSSLINGKIEWDVTDSSTPVNIDFNPRDIVLPVSADSSQLSAVLEAVDGNSFILHGPPGTGKSQTITNLIANALYRGKRVLFVAEKMAALSVVQKRLAGIGLAPFCLELHSNKTKKSAILEQLKACMEVTKTQSPEEFVKEAERIYAIRHKLKKHIDDLHTEYPFGISLYQAIVKYENENSDSVFHFPNELIAELDKEELEKWEDAISAMVSSLKASGQPANNPLRGIDIGNFTQQLKTDIEDKLLLLKTSQLQLDKEFSDFKDLLQNLPFGSVKELWILETIINLIMTIPELTSTFLTLPALKTEIEYYDEIANRGLLRDEIKQKLQKNFNDRFFDLDAKNYISQWQEANTKWALPQYFGTNKIIKIINNYSSVKIHKEEILNVLSDLQRYQTEKTFVEQNQQNLSKLFGKYGKKDHENWEQIKIILQKTKLLNDAILELTQNIDYSNAVKSHLSGFLSDGIETFIKINGNRLNSFLEKINSFKIVYNDLVRLVNISEEKLSELSYQQFTNVTNAWADNINELKNWYQWLLSSRRLKEDGLGEIVEYIENNMIVPDQIIGIFHKSLYKAIITYILDDNQDLQLFNGQIFSDTISRYKKMVQDFQTLTRLELVARLASNLPNLTMEASQNSEVGILQKNIRNNARGMSIRKLFDQIPTLLSRLCPCMLMSPISVAQYIDINAEKFDLIVFDEASQMPTYEAIGAIARGNAVVIVGDPKQMPPTNFFSVGNKDEENIELEDLESILDDCLALSMPSKYLLWHYRSRHESLIAFSNTEYYENKLNTFPSPDNITSKVTFVPVDGVYDKGKTRQNKAEAEEIVKEIERRLRDPELRKKSIGVVTFSIVQQSLVEDLLSDLFALDHQLEALAMDSEEPIFVKNLENVQGDERDVILFSVCYGPDEDGKVSMNFGPLNRVGGERRLNVAVTRARYEMMIFSTLKPEQIDLNRTSSLGVAGLRRFMEFAQNRFVTTQNTDQKKTSSIDVLIAQKLLEKGYETHVNIGCSGYRIDLGIVDKNVPGTYALGIICDGVTLSDGETIRDREIVQPGVLKGLGWRIHRVWTLDWFENPDSVIEDIISVLNNKQIENKAQSTQSQESEPINIPSHEVTEQASTDSDNQRISNQNYILTLKQTYTENTIRPLNFGIDAFVMVENKNTIVSMLHKIIREEYPISQNLLSKKIIYIWGISKATPRISTYLESLYSQLEEFTTNYEGQIYYWPSQESVDIYDIFRIESGRDVSDIAPEEFANAMRYVLVSNISLPIPDLVKLTGQLMGFPRNTANVEASVKLGIPIAERREFLKIENERAIEL